MLPLAAEYELPLAALPLVPLAVPPLEVPAVATVPFDPVLPAALLWESAFARGSCTPQPATQMPAHRPDRNNPLANKSLTREMP